MGEGWTGAGLPPGAAARVAGSRGSGSGSGTWSSALSAGEFAALRTVEFAPVGLVMGSAVHHVGRVGRYWGYHDCLCRDSSRRARWGRTTVALSGRGAPSAELVGVLTRARESALERMRTECSALGGDGVVAARLTVGPFATQPDCLEFRVIGTAVRAAGAVRPPRPFTCHLDGTGFAKLVTAGWVPVELLYGMSVGVLHDDIFVRAETDTWDNTEVRGWTELVRDVRADARAHFGKQAEGRGGDGVILSATDLRVWAEPCIWGNDAKDHLAEATLVGTTVARFTARARAPRTLTVMPLGTERRRPAAGRTGSDDLR
ncbi:MAG: heavy metal-binding domain-containing protein [Streptomyces sp.]|nr:heavy metal-binding domain-containing protein [Streptomyces sp.]